MIWTVSCIRSAVTHSAALAVRTTTKALRGSGINLAATAAEVTRLRLGLEGTWHNALPLGLVPTFEIGVRYDGGDAETGFGADLGAGLTWADPVRGIRAEFHARGLVGHEDDGFREFGLSGLLFWDAMPDSDLGWSLGIAQAMGARATGGTACGGPGRRTRTPLRGPDDGAVVNVPAAPSGLRHRRFHLQTGG